MKPSQSKRDRRWPSSDKQIFFLPLHVLSWIAFLSAAWWTTLLVVWSLESSLTWNNLCWFHLSECRVWHTEVMTSRKTRLACRNVKMGWKTGNATETGGVVCASHERSEHCLWLCQDWLKTDSGREPKRISTLDFTPFEMNVAIHSVLRFKYLWCFKQGF